MKRFISALAAVVLIAVAAHAQMNMKSFFQIVDAYSISTVKRIASQNGYKFQGNFDSQYIWTRNCSFGGSLYKGANWNKIENAGAASSGLQMYWLDDDGHKQMSLSVVGASNASSRIAELKRMGYREVSSPKSPVRTFKNPDDLDVYVRKHGNIYYFILYFTH